MKPPRLLLIVLFIITAARLLAASAPPAAPTEEEQVRLTNTPTRQERRVLKATPPDELVLHLFMPEDGKASDRRPALVFFHGAGSGGAQKFFPQAEYFASRGMVCVALEYPIFMSNGKISRIDENVGQAKSVMRWLRAHADELGVAASKVVAVGSSMGGGLALMTVLSPEFDLAADNRAISCEPNALVLFAPVVRFRDGHLNAAGDPITNSVSPALFLNKKLPPAIVFFGTADKQAEPGEKFFADAKALGSRYEYFTAPDQPHGFHNREPWTTATTHEVDRFLVSLGYLSGAATLAPAKAELTAVK